MSCVHEFGVINHIEKNKNYGVYEPDKYNCTAIDDDFFNAICFRNREGLNKLETFACSMDRPYYGLCWCGVTIIPPKSVKELLDIVIKEMGFYDSRELDSLHEVISKANRENKYVIHFGI